MSPIMRKAAFHICENKRADQLRGNHTADQRLCFCYIDSKIPPCPKSEISSLYPSSVAAQPGLCCTWSEILKTGFLVTHLICNDPKFSQRQVLVSENSEDRDQTVPDDSV